MHVTTTQADHSRAQCATRSTHQARSGRLAPLAAEAMPSKTAAPTCRAYSITPPHPSTSGPSRGLVPQGRVAAPKPAAVKSRPSVLRRAHPISRPPAHFDFPPPSQLDSASAPQPAPTRSSSICRWRRATCLHAELPVKARPHKSAGAKPTTPRAGQPPRHGSVPPPARGPSSRGVGNLPPPTRVPGAAAKARPHKTLAQSPPPRAPGTAAKTAASRRPLSGVFFVVIAAVFQQGRAAAPEPEAVESQPFDPPARPPNPRPPTPF